MKQLVIYCSSDLEERVISALDHARVDGYLRTGRATANVFQPPGEIPRAVSWEAAVFTVPAATEERIGIVARELEQYIKDCDIEPCLKLVTIPVDRAW